MSNFAVRDADDTVITEYDGGYIDPGATKNIEFQYENISGVDLEDIVHFPFPGLVNDTFTNTVNTPLAGVEIIRQNSQGVNQTSTLAKESSDSDLTAYEGRVKCLEYISGAYTERHTGAVNFMNGASDYVYLLCDRKILNIYVDLDTNGSYTGFDVEIWTGAAWETPASLSDGTSGLTGDGVIQIDATSAADWEKKTFSGSGIANPLTGYPVRFSCTAVTTQAVSATDGLYWEYAYTLPVSFLYGLGEYYRYTAPSTYTQIYPTYEYANLGMVVFLADPLSTGDSIRSNLTYKNPQDGTYEIVATDTDEVTIEKDGGGASAGIGVQTGIDPNTGEYYANTNILDGVDIKLNALTAGDTGEFIICDKLKYIDWSTDDTTYYNNDIDIADLDAGEKDTVYGKFSAPMGTAESENIGYIEFFAEGS
jgi:hypothetical protein